MTVTVAQPVVAFEVGDRAYSSVILADSPTLFWRLGTAGLTDASTGGHNGTAAGGLSLGGVAAPGLLTEQPVGAGLETDKATTFGGGYATSTYATWAVTVATYEGWASRTSTGAQHTLIAGDGSATTQPELFIANGSEDVTFRIRHNDTGATSQCTWTAGWPGVAQAVYWTLILDQTNHTAEFFANGVSQGIKTGLTQTMSSAGNLLLGATGSGFASTFAGTMDEVAVYAARVSPERVWSHFQAGKIRYAVPGTAPALLKVTLTDAATQDRDHVEVGVQKNHDATVTQRLLFTASELTTTNMAGAANTRPGAYDPTGGTATVRATLTTSPLAICQALAVKNLGRHQIRARIYGSGTGPIYVRATVQVGNSPFIPASKGWVAVPQLLNWYDLDLGQSKIATVLSGTTQQATIQIEAYSQTSGDTVDINALGPLPTDRFVRCRAPLRSVAAGLLTASDSFNQTAGNLNGKTADKGGNWTTFGASALDWVIDATNHYAFKTGNADGTWASKWAVIGSDLTLSAVSCDFQHQIRMQAPAKVGVILRQLTGTTNVWLYFGTFLIGSLPSQPAFGVWKSDAGGVVQLGQSPVLSWLTPGTWFTIQGYADARGTWAGFLAVRGVPTATPLLVGQDSALATGGTVAAGRPGIYGEISTNDGAAADNFQAWVPSPSHVCTASQALQVDHQQALRIDSGNVQAQPPTVEGRTFPKLNPGEISRVAVKARRADAEMLPDQGLTDSTQVAVTVTPRVQLLG
jgi:hypothetical protein